MRLTGDFRAAAVMTVNNIEAAIRLSAAGMGIAYVPDFVVREAMDEDNCRRCCPAVASGWAFLGPVARQPLPVTKNTLFYRFYSCGRDTFVARIGKPYHLKSSAPEILPPGQRKPAAGISQGSILPFGKIGLDPLLQIILGADGRVLPLRPEDLDIFIGLAENARL